MIMCTFIHVYTSFYVMFCYMLLVIKFIENTSKKLNDSLPNQVKDPLFIFSTLNLSEQ